TAVTRRSQEPTNQQSPVIKGVLPDAPAPVAPPKPVAEPTTEVKPPSAAAGQAPAEKGFFGWIKGLFGGGSTATPSTAQPAASPSASPDKKEANRESRQSDGRRGGRRGERSDRGDRGEREERGDKPARAERPPRETRSSERVTERSERNRGPRAERTPRTERDNAAATPEAVNPTAGPNGEATAVPTDRPARAEREGRRERGEGRRERGERRPRQGESNNSANSAQGTDGLSANEASGLASHSALQGEPSALSNQQGDTSPSQAPDVQERRERRSRDRYGRERHERQDRSSSPEAPTPAASAEPASGGAPTVAPASRNAMPKVGSYDLPLQALNDLAQHSGLEWVHSNADRVAQVQAAIAAEPRPIHVPRERPPVVVVNEGPLIMVETRKDLRQMSMPFDPPASAA
ncbi:MAG: ribonuclease E/G, partial [Betaproteobacteria bacterium]|nr:ribonuclease E/G [Betaproteobacteria bacterium]